MKRKNDGNQQNLGRVILTDALTFWARPSEF